MLTPKKIAELRELLLAEYGYGGRLGPRSNAALCALLEDHERQAAHIAELERDLKDTRLQQGSAEDEVSCLRDKLVYFDDVEERLKKAEAEISEARAAAHASNAALAEMGVQLRAEEASNAALKARCEALEWAREVELTGPLVRGVILRREKKQKDAAESEFLRTVVAALRAAGE